jgi:hypothetical protein
VLPPPPGGGEGGGSCSPASPLDPGVAAGGPSPSESGTASGPEDSRVATVREHLKQDAARAATTGSRGPAGAARPAAAWPAAQCLRPQDSDAGMQPAHHFPPPGPAGRHLSLSVSLPCLKSASDRNLLLPRRAAGAWAGGRGGAAWLWHLGRTSSGSHGRGRALRRLQRSSLRSVRVPAAAAAPSRSAQAHWLLPGRDPDRHGDSPGGYPMTVTVTARG